MTSRGIFGTAPNPSDIVARAVKSPLGHTNPNYLKGGSIPIGSDFYQTQTSRQLEKGITEDGTRLPDSIAWQNMLDEQKRKQDAKAVSLGFGKAERTDLLGSGFGSKSVFDGSGAPTSHFAETSRAVVKGLQKLNLRPPKVDIPPTPRPKLPRKSSAPLLRIEESRPNFLNLSYSKVSPESRIETPRRNPPRGVKRGRRI